MDRNGSNQITGPRSGLTPAPQGVKPYSFDTQNRARINVTAEEYQKAALVTGKVQPVEIFRELLRLAETRDQLSDNGKMPMEYNRNPAQYNFDADNRSERKYWEARMERARALTAELHLAREIGKMEKSELEIVLEAPKRLPVYTDDTVKCYKCHERGHWPSQCLKSW